MHTEAEAKMKLCPLSIGVGTGACIASGCMAWRKGPRSSRRYFVSYNGKPEEEWNWNPERSQGYEDAKVRIVEGDQYGFCGLAGRADHT